MRAILLALAALAAVFGSWQLGCGPTTAATTSGMTPDAGPPPAITTPPLVCGPAGRGCSCAPMDGGVVDASAGLCDLSVAPDASCCAGEGYPFEGSCLCAVNACADGGGPVASCSLPPAEIPAGACDPANCSGMSCGGGECCVSACQGGVCQSICS